MSYVVLARKWRPMSFDDLVGQDHVARTLGNAISVGRVAHAFLFTGVRGVGKTTSARILAKALNCMGDPATTPAGSDPGPTVHPCLKCAACQEIALGTDVDVREIDGASYNGVDEVRKLQDSLPYRPNRDRYKIVIVDEVHMLTPAAWNAFLKTLEEPPPHVKFIFATTEVHKVPITILSRVQRFDFKMIPARTIAQRVRYVLDEEKIVADDTSIALISRQAAGSMRDAMSLLDQVIAFSGNELVGEEVARALGAASRSKLAEVARSLVHGQPAECLEKISELADQGFDIPHVAKDLLALLRDLVVAKVVKNPRELLDVSDEELKAVETLASEAQESDLLRLHQAFSKSFDDIVRGGDPRSSLEMLLVRLSLRPQLLPVDELLHRLGNLERRLLEGGGRPPSGGGGHPPPTRPHAPERRPPESNLPRGREHTSASSQPKAANENAADDGPHRRDAEPNRAPAPTPAPSTPSTSSGANRDAEKTPSPQPSFPPQNPTPQPIPRVPELPPDVLARLEQVLPVADALREEQPELSPFFEQSVPLRVVDGRLEMGLEPGFLFEKQLEAPDAQRRLELTLKRLWGETAELVFVKNAKDATPERAIAAERARRKKAKHDAAVEEVRRHPKVQAIARIFGAEVKTVRVPEV